MSHKIHLMQNITISVYEKDFLIDFLKVNMRVDLPTLSLASEKTLRECVRQSTVVCTRHSTKLNY